MVGPDCPTPLPLPQLRALLAVHLPLAFEGLDWWQDGEVYFAKLPATRPDGTVDIYVTKWTFFDYPTEPPHVTFVNPETLKYDPSAWPNAGNGRVALSPVYGDAPEGLICNSMFYDWYYYGGHGQQPAVSWKPGIHTATATVSELREVLRPPHYQGPR
jgi:hypothetical protein